MSENSTRFAKDHLKAFVERIERLEEEKKALADDIRDVYAEAKGCGFDTKAIKACIKLRKVDATDRAEQLAILETYMHALGMLDDIPGAAGERPLRSERKEPRAQACAVHCDCVRSSIPEESHALQIRGRGARPMSGQRSGHRPVRNYQSRARG